MKEIVLNLSGEDYLDQLLEYLRGQIFHVTSISGYKGILQAGEISGDRQLPSNGHGNTSYGRSRGWICLYDFFNSTVLEQKAGVKVCNYFPPPSVPNEDAGEYRVRRFVCLIISKHFYKNLIPNAITKKLPPIGKSVLHVPKIERWSQQSIPLQHIERVVQISIKRQISPCQRCLEAVADIKRQEKKNDIYARGE